MYCAVCKDLIPTFTYDLCKKLDNNNWLCHYCTKLYDKGSRIFMRTMRKQGLTSEKNPNETYTR